MPKHDPLIPATMATAREHAKKLALAAGPDHPASFFGRMARAHQAAIELDRIVQSSKHA